MTPRFGSLPRAHRVRTKCVVATGQCGRRFWTEVWQKTGGVGGISKNPRSVGGSQDRGGKGFYGRTGQSKRPETGIKLGAVGASIQSLALGGRVRRVGTFCLTPSCSLESHLPLLRCCQK